jgi:peptidyl-prolyl cis-trans isomerase C
MNTLNRLRCGLSMLGVLGVVALGEAQSAAQTSPTTTAAVVNGSKITLAEVDAVLKARPTLGPLTAAQQRQLRFEILSVMIDEMLLQQYFDKHGPKVEPAEVEAQLKALSEALARQKLTLQSYCAEQGITEKKLREGIKIVQQLTRYTEAKMTDAALRQYYEANRAYFDKVTVRAAHIVLRVPANAPESERAQARQKLAAMRAELLAGKADFAELAKRYSQCPSAARGGDIGFFAAKWMDLDESFVQAAFAAKVGDITEPVDTEFGVHLIKVLERTPGIPSTFEKVIDEVRDSFAQDVRANLLDELRKVAKVEITLP